ncbi:MAG: S1C family serine protease [Thermoleophilaceae bacterium]
MGVGSWATLLALTLSACGGGDHTVTTRAPTPNSQLPTPVTKTPAKAVGASGSGAFNPEAIYRSLAPGVVTIISLNSNPRTTSLGRQRGSLGSGFVVDGSGYIATNAHVVTSGSGSRARAVYIEFSDGNRLTARIVGTDPFSDVALVKVDPGQLRGRDAKLVSLPLGSSAELTVGDPVAAIGSPFGEEQSLSVGVVSATGRDIASLTGFPISNAIQTDAAINHGNSGGPLLDAKGRVIGINSQIRSTGGGGEGVGFAIPVETAKRALDQLRASGHVEYAYLGISSQPLYPQLAARLRLPVLSGALVDIVRDGSPAQKARLRGARSHITFQADRVPVGSDVVLAVGGHKIRDAKDLSAVIGAYRPGTRVTLVILREGRRQTLAVTLGKRPNGTGG